MTYIYIYIYTDTNPITLPCSLARAGKNEVQCRDDVMCLQKGKWGCEVTKLSCLPLSIVTSVHDE